MKLNLGSGNKPENGFVNIDKNPAFMPDVVMNLDCPGDNLKEDSVDFVQMNHVLEHLYHPIDLFNWLYRVCKKGAIIHIEVPHKTNVNFWDDPTHVRPWCEASFDMICDLERSKLLGITGKFKKKHYQKIGNVESVCVVDLEAVK